MSIDTLDALRLLYPQPKGVAAKKQLSHLDPHCRRFIGLSPFLVIASRNSAGDQDASPRGGDPGFVQIADEKTLLIPDAKGNNRLDTLTNIIETGKVGLLFLIPGVNETLRVNGDARLSDAATLIAQFGAMRRTPTLVIEIAIKEAYLHCAKAFMRSKLWTGENRVDRSTLPTIEQLIADQIGAPASTETHAEMVLRYTNDL